MSRTARLLLSASAMAALLGASASGAFAFDKVHWNWYKTVWERDKIDVDIDVKVKTDGLVQVEKMQINIGDTKAYASIHDINNNIGGREPPPPKPGKDWDKYTHNPGPKNPPPPPPPLEAKNLPEVVNAATAVGNNQSITADVPVFLHDGQYNFGGFNDFSDSSRNELIAAILGAEAADAAFDEFSGDNLHTAAAFALTLAGAAGIIEPAKVKAEAKVSDILNAFVDNSATAVANNISIDVASNEDPHTWNDNHVVMADITQFNYGDVKAKAEVCDVDINGYTNFDGAGMGPKAGDDIIPIVSNVATAVGNNMTIKVGVNTP